MRTPQRPQAGQPLQQPPQPLQPPPGPPPLPLPEGVELYIAPGMQTVSFGELLRGYGIVRDVGQWMEDMQNQLGELQRQIDELRNQ